MTASLWVVYRVDVVRYCFPAIHRSESHMFYLHASVHMLCDLKCYCHQVSISDKFLTDCHKSEDGKWTVHLDTVYASEIQVTYETEPYVKSVCR